MEDMRTILFYFHDQEDIYQAERLTFILQKLTSQGYYLIAQEEWGDTYTRLFGSPLQSSTENDDTLPIAFQSGLSTQALAQCEQFLQQKGERSFLNGFWVADNGPGRGFDFSLSLQGEDGSLMLTFDEDFFTRTDRESHYEQWLNTIKAIYEVGHFFYVYQIDHTGIHQPTTREEFLTDGVIRLYDLNIFSPELVEQLGRERLLSTSAERIVTLNDSSILLITRIFFYPLHPNVVFAEPKDIARYLGLSYGDE